MRNRRLLTLAVLAVALGLTAFAQADIAVVTVIKDATSTGGDGTFAINVRLWGDDGIGTAADSPGLMDFALRSIAGADGLDVDTVDYEAPMAQVTDDTTTYDAAFSALHGVWTGADGTLNVAGLQPAIYTGGQDDLRDAAVVLGVGVADRASSTATQNGTGHLLDALAFSADTLIASGTYSGEDTGSVAVITFGSVSFTPLPAATPFVGPITNINPSPLPTVTAVVIQTTTVTGNDGGAIAADNATTLMVESGDIKLGSAFAGGTNVTVQVSEADTSVTFTGDVVLGGTDNETAGTLGGLDIRMGNDGYQVVNTAAALVSVVTPDPEQTYLNILAMLGDENDGLYSSEVDQAYETLVVTYGPTGDRILIKAALLGDVNMDGVIDPSDSALINVNWDPSGTNLLGQDKCWLLGDLNMDGVVDPGDSALINVYWNPTGIFAAPAGVPEPGTVSLLVLGAFGLIRRRKA